MNRYQNGQIYKIVDVGYNKCYIGSTTETLSQRMARHRGDYQSYLNNTHPNKSYTNSVKLFDEYGVENCKIEWVEDYPCFSRKELEAREGYHILRDKSCLNRVVVGRTRKEHYDTHREHHLQQKKQHRLDNIEQYKEKDKKYHEENKEKRNEYSKKYYNENKEMFYEKNLKYREENREAIRQQQRERYQRDKDIINTRRRERRKQKKEQQMSINQE